MRNQAAVPAVAPVTPDPYDSFDFHGELIRTFYEGEKVWFSAKDVCRAIGLMNTGMAIRPIPNEHKCIKNSYTSNGVHPLSVIDEAGINRIVLRSTKPKAQPFIEWVTAEVLPSIRKTGSYTKSPTMADLQKHFDIPKDYSSALRLAADLKDEVDKLETKIAVDAPKVRFSTQVEESVNTITVGQLAKVLCKRGYEIGQNRLFRFLRNHNILMLNNEPYQRYLNQGWFEVREYIKTTSRGTFVKSQTIVTGRGQLAIAELIRKEQVRLTAPIANVQRRLAA